MKRKFIAIVAAAVLSATVLGGCGGMDESKESTDIPSTEQTKVWSTYNTRKVIRQTDKNDEYEKLDASFTVDMYKGEYEGAQIIVTADKRTEYKIEKGTLKTADGKEFPSDQIELYHQKYIEVAKNNSGNGDYESGSFIPDMLLPIDTAIAYKENFVEAGGNQGITAEFNSEGVEAGVYTGTFKLTLGDEIKDIPVSVNVWNIEYEGRRTFQSSFLLYRNALASAEYDSSDEVVKRYEDFLLKYKINTYVIKDRNEWTTEEVVSRAQELYADDNYSSIIIPFDFPLSYRTYNGKKLTGDAQKVTDYILGLAAISTETDNYLDLAYFYPSTYDESDINGTGSYSETFLKKGGEYDKTLAAAAEAIDTDERFANKSDELKQTLKESILKIPAVFTNVNYVADWVGSLNATFCPYFSLYNDMATLQRYQDAAKANTNGDMWAYTCMGPKYPYGTFHIDDSTLGMRASGWMEKAMGITGYLYYAVNMSTQFRLSDEVYTDVYNNPLRYENVPGDGYLMYPGKYYGSEAPFASVRLVSFRDSMDDYDMLSVYEKLVNEYAEKNGIEIDFNELVNDLYAELFDGAVYYQQDSLLYKARKELANRILSLKSGTLVKKSGTEKTIAASAAKVSDGSELIVSEGSAVAVLKSQYKDKGETIGVKTKLFRPGISFAADELKNATGFSFSYTNDGENEFEMIISLVDKDGVSYDVLTNYCPAGVTRRVSVELSEQFLKRMKMDMSSVSEIRISFDNVSYAKNGQIELAGNRTIKCDDVAIRVK